MSADRSFARRHEWALVAGLALLAVALGIAGFREHPDYRGQSAIGLIYLALQLFPLQSGAVGPPLPWALEVARFLAPAITVYAAGRALVELLGEHIARVRLRRSSRHVVIAGTGRRGTQLAQAFLAQGERVVVVDRNLSASGASACRAAGALVVEGDATSDSVLTEAGAQRARLTIAACGEETTNAAVAVTMHALAGSGSTAEPNTCVALLTDPQLCGLLREAELGGRRLEHFRLEFVNIFELAARALLDRHCTASPAAARHHLIVAGLGRLGRALVVQAVRARPSNERGNPLHITVIERDAPAAVSKFLAGQPGLADACQLTPVSLDSLSATAGQLPPAAVAFVCFDHDALAFTTALTLGRAHSGLKVAVRTTELAGLAPMLDGARLSPFDIIRETCQPSLMFGLNESLAMALHHDYRQSRPPSDSSPANVAWHALPEEFRESNRRRAQDLTSALRHLDCRLLLAASWRPAVWSFSTGEVDALAEREHERWRREREQMDWRFEPGERSDAARTSPLLTPWAGLPEAIRQGNRLAVAALPDLLAREGFEIVRTGQRERRR